MNLSQALEHANAFMFPELIYGSGYQVMDSERDKNEEAIDLLREAWKKEEKPGFPFGIVRELADRNRALCDEIGADRLENASGRNLERGLTDEEVCQGIASMQGRTAQAVLREIRGDRSALGAAYVSKPVKGTVLGIDIETTSRDPDRGYIINVGWELMDLTSDATPRDGQAVWPGIPEMYAEKGVPLERIHHITWSMLDGHTPFREDRELQATLLKLMQTYPYMAHNAAFEDSWFMLHLDGYAEGRKAGKIVPIDTRDICRRLDGEVATLPRESSPASLENWALRRGTLKAGEEERHLGLDDTDLMLRTVHAEFSRKNMFAK